MGIFNFDKWLPCMCYITSFDKYFCSTEQNTFFNYLKMSFFRELERGTTTKDKGILLY